MRVMTVIILTVGLLLPATSRSEDAGVLWDKNCKRCHGVDGKGVEKLLGILKLKDRGIAALDVLKPESVKLTDAEMTKIILDGKGAQMKPMKDKFTASEVAGLVAHVRKLQAAK